VIFQLTGTETRTEINSSQLTKTETEKKTEKGTEIINTEK